LTSLDQPIPNDPKHLHFGAGQTEAAVTLPLGKHKLQLFLADCVEFHAILTHHFHPILTHPYSSLAGSRCG